MENWNYFDGSKWNEVNEEWVNGIKNIDKIDEIFTAGNEKIEVVYKTGERIFYQNIHGTWGNPTIIK